MPSDDAWMDTEIDMDKATGKAAAATLQAVVKTLQEAPTENRFDVSVEVEER